MDKKLIYLLLILVVILLLIYIIENLKRNKIEIEVIDDTLIKYKKGTSYVKKENHLNIVFIHIPKNAGSYIRTYIKGANNNYDHMSLSELKQNFPNVYKHNMFFCVVRNPYDRIVSNYEFALQKSNTGITQKLANKIFKNEKIQTFEAFVNYLHSDKKRLYKVIHWHPQYKFVELNGSIPEKGKLRILRKENLTEDFSKLLESQNINITLSSEKVNSTIHKKYTEYYKTKDIINKVYEIYKEDFEYFSYNF